MKRSEINALMQQAKDFFQEHHFLLPPWAFWSPEQWKGKAEACAEIRDNMLGWDITDFGSDDFEKKGLLLFTIRNGNPNKDSKVYAEKIMIVREDQETPWHFHWKKMEDIINRGGGTLVIDLYNSDENERFSSAPVQVKIDGVLHEVQPGGQVELAPGESICLYQGLYHRFYAKPGEGWVLTGEVSQVNDDTTDNRFYEAIGRFPEIEEDEAPMHLLVGDYPKYM
ncbi:MAG: D-lyxose/D-mannose family sugar isomerase [Candidatus Sumerlaeia bacterium]